MMVQKNNRLDSLLVSTGKYTTRSRARDAVMRGCISIDGKIATKAGMPVSFESVISINDAARNYVSRAALKLLHAIEQYEINVEGEICLDIGASTGGFTQILLENGATQVFAVDVGHGQMDAAIASDNRVIDLSGVNARDLEIAHLNHLQPAIVVSDVSFISLKLALPRALGLAAGGAQGIFLVKPQFEVGRQNIGKGGLVCDEAVGLAAVHDIGDWLDEQPNWQVAKLFASPISGSDGNREYILTADKAP